MSIIMGSLTEARKRMEAKGSVGLFTKKAHAAGKSTQEFAREKSHAGGTLGKEANFARMAKRHWKSLSKS
jgi:hypothetical protein